MVGTGYDRAVPQSTPRGVWILALALALALALTLGAPAAAQARGRLLGIFARTAPPAAFGAALPSRAAAPGAGGPTGHLSYLGGPVMHAHRTFVIFWDPNHALSADFEARLGGYLTDVGADSGTPTNVYSVATEYGDSAGSVGYRSSFGGSFVDTSAYPPETCAVGTLGLATAPCLTDAAIQAEIAAVLPRAGWGPGLDRAYFVLTPPGVVSCQDTTTAQCSTNAFCAYHSQLLGYPAFPDASPVVYANIPWADVDGCRPPQAPNDPAADAAVNIISHEHIEMLTDPLVNQPAWVDTADQSEIADKCRRSYSAPGPGAGNETINAHGYMLQAEFSNAQNACLGRTAENQPPVARFTAAATGDQQTFSFDAGASTDADGRILAYTWDFGDGQVGAAPQTSHAYVGQGARTVTLTVADNAGGRSSAAQTVQPGAAPPAEPPPAITPPPSAPPPPAAPAAAGAPAAATAAPLGRLTAPPGRLTAAAVFGTLTARGLSGSITASRVARVEVDLLIPRALAVRLRLRAGADGGPRSTQVILASAVLGAVGPGRAAYAVRLAAAAVAVLRRAAPVTLGVRATVTSPGQAPVVVSSRRRFHR